MTVDDSERRRLREQLATGEADQADHAMCLLLDVPTPAELDPADLRGALAAMDRLGLAGQAAMAETFMLLAQRHLEASVPVLIEEARRDPHGWPGRLSADTLFEVLIYSPEAGTTDVDLLRRAREGLETTGFTKLLDEVRARAATLPLEHPLRLAMAL